MQRGGLGKLCFENRLDAPIKLGGLECGSEQWNTRLFCGVEQLFGRILIFGDDHGRHRKAEKAAENARALGGRKREQIRDFRLSQYLQSFRYEAVDVAGESEARARDVRVWNRSIETRAAQVGKTESLSERFQELSNCKSPAQTVAAFPAVVRLAVLRLARSD